jgi:uncharacterized protein (DUF1919 family)
MRILNNFKQSLANAILRKRVRNKDFTIISVNCVGGSIYRQFRRPYSSPFVGVALPGECYVKLLGNLQEYLEQELVFASTSRFQYVNNLRRKRGTYYPIGILGDDIEIHFIHYANEDLARQKWNIRRKRVNMDNLFIEFSDEYLCEERHVREFDCLDYPHKVVFTAKPYPDLKSAVWLNEYADQPHVVDLFSNQHIFHRHFDLADWFNGGTGAVTPAYRLINRLLESPIQG